MTNTEIILSISGLFIAAVSLLLSILTAGIAVVAVIEWRSYKDFQKKKKEAIAEYKQIANQSVAAKDDFQREAASILDTIKKQKNKKLTGEQEIKLNELAKKIDNIIEKTENRLQTIDSSNFTLYNSGTPFVSSTSVTPFVGYNSYSALPHFCIRCGKSYTLNLSGLDTGLCEDCKIIIKK